VLVKHGLSLYYSLVTVKARILDEFGIFSLPGGGIGSWLGERADSIVFDRLAVMDMQPLSKVQLNQLLLLAHEGGVSLGFFEYYWADAPPDHPYNVRSLPGLVEDWLKHPRSRIHSLTHLKWGMYRLYIDGLLFFGDVRNAYRSLRVKSKLLEKITKSAVRLQTNDQLLAQTFWNCYHNRPQT
jgi:hypothetical protein